jgi:hypothetical protein
VVICPVPDTTPPTVEITKPINALYFINTEIIPLESPLIIGKIDINVNATDDESGMDRVEFYIDEQLTETDTTTEPYNWLWGEKGFFTYTIKVVAYDKEGNSQTQILEVLKFF